MYVFYKNTCMFSPSSAFLKFLKVWIESESRKLEPYNIIAAVAALNRLLNINLNTYFKIIGYWLFLKEKYWFFFLLFSNLRFKDLVTLLFLFSFRFSCLIWLSSKIFLKPTILKMLLKTNTQRNSICQLLKIRGKKMCAPFFFSQIIFFCVKCGFMMSRWLFSLLETCYAIFVVLKLIMTIFQ